jgi:hypothetical protein
MLEPSAENPLNLESYSSYLTKPEFFEKQAQLSLAGGFFSGVHFPCVLLSINEMAMRNFPIHTKRNHYECNDDHDDEEEEGDGMLIIGRIPRRRGIKNSWKLSSGDPCGFSGGAAGLSDEKK